MHKCASEENDASLCDFLETHFIQEQIDGQKILANYISQFERCETDLGCHVFDSGLCDKGLHSK